MATIVSGTGIVFPDLTTQATAGITPGASLAFTGANTFAGTTGFNGAVTLSSGLKDSGGNLGTAGQILSTTGSATLWVNSGIPSAQSANLVYAGPVSGVAAVPTFRGIVPADLITALGSPPSIGGTVASSATFTNAALTTGQITTAPVAANDITNKNYVDLYVQGLTSQQSVKAATTANILLSGAQIIDGVSVVAGDEVLVKNQAATAANGVYVVAAGAWTRATAMNTWSQFHAAFVFVQTGGTANGATGWVCTSPIAGTINVTAVSFEQFSAAGTYTAGAGLTLTGTVFSANETSFTTGVSANGSLAAVIASLTTSDVKGNSYSLFNTTGATVTLTTTINNAVSYPNNATGGSVIIGAGETVVVETVTANSTYSVLSSSNSAATFTAQSANRVFAGPASGAAAVPTFRGIASLDLTTALTTPPAIGGTTPAAATFTDLTVNGNTILGDASTDAVTLNAATVTLNNNTIISAASTKTITLNGGAGSNGLVIDANNNVGIGTASPNILTSGKALTILGAGTTRGSIELGSTTAILAGIFGQASGYNGPTLAATMQFFGDNATDSGAIRFSTKATGGALTARMRLDSVGNLGLGVTPSPWYTTSGNIALDIGTYATFAQIGSTGGAAVVSNAYLNSAGLWVAKNTNPNGATLYQGLPGGHFWSYAINVTGGTTFTFTQAMSLDYNGNLHVPGGGGVTSNEAFGTGALKSNTTGSQNTALGYNALFSNLVGSGNVAIGDSALVANTNGGNTAVGSSALATNTSGYYNTANGFQALYTNTTGNNNTAVGFQALSSNTIGTNSTAIGLGALQANTTGICNTAIGVTALAANGTGSGNTTISPLTSTGAYAPVFDPTTEDDRFCMGSTSVTNAYINVPWSIVSDARDKTNIAPLHLGLDFVTKLEPVEYQRVDNREDKNATGPIRYGFLAQDILAIEGDKPVIIDNEDPERLKMNDSAVIAVLVQAIKELKAELDTLKGAKL